jgi:hypothetical protein
MIKRRRRSSTSVAYLQQRYLIMQPNGSVQGIADDNVFRPQTMDWCIYITTKTKMARCHIMDCNTIMIKLFLLKKIF